MTVPTSVAADATGSAPLSMAEAMFRAERPTLTYAQKACQVSIQRRNAVTALDPDSERWIGKWNVRISRVNGTTDIYYYCIDTSDDAEVRKIIPRLFGDASQFEPRNIGTSLMTGTTPLVMAMVGASKKPDITIQVLMADAYNYFDLVDSNWKNETEPTSMESLYPIKPQPRRPRMDFFKFKGMSPTRWQAWRRLHIAYGYRGLVRPPPNIQVP